MAGRHKAVIDWEKVDKMLQAGCTGTEVAAALGYHPDTLYFEMMPKVTAEHKSESFDVLGRAFQRIVLNKESDN